MGWGRQRRNVRLPIFILAGAIAGGALLAAPTAASEEPVGRQGLINSLQQEIQQKEQEIQRLLQEAQRYRTEVESTQAQRATLEREIAVIDGRIRKLRADISVTQAKTDAAALRIAQLGHEIRSQEDTIGQTRDHIASIMRTLYRADDQTLLELTLKYDALSDALNEVYALQRLSDRLHEELANLRSHKQLLETQRTDANSEREKLSALQTQLSSQRATVEDQRSERQSILKTTKGRETEFQRLLADVERQQEEIQREIFELEDQLRRAADPSSIPAARSGILAWPTEGILTQRYGPTSQTGFRNHVYTFHNGIDVAAGFGSPIRAARAGTVRAVGNNGRYAYGKWAAIEHDNGLTTLYAHLSNWNVRQGQTVNQGDVIGFEGATGFSTGSHLHFTVYIANQLRFEERWFGLLPIGATVNPMDYL